MLWNYCLAQVTDLATDKAEASEPLPISASSLIFLVMLSYSGEYLTHRMISLRRKDQEVSSHTAITSESQIKDGITRQ